MSIQNQQVIKHLLIGSNQARSGYTSGTTKLSSLVAGEVAVIDMDGYVLDAGTVVSKDRVIIGQSQGSSLPPILSPVIKKATVKTYKGGKYVAATQQIDYVGYNGTSGSIDALNSNAYKMEIVFSDNQNWKDKQPSLLGYHKSDSTATQAEIAAGLHRTIVGTLNGYTKKPVKVELVSSVASLTAGFSGPGLIFTQYSNTVIADATTSLTGIPSAGDFISVAATANTPVYKVLSATQASGSTVAVIVLESAYQGATATIATGTYAKLTAANAAASNFGLVVTGLSQAITADEINNGGMAEYQFIRFKTNLIDGGSTTLASPSTAGVAGTGLPAQVKVLERQLLGNEGFLNPGAMPFVSPRSNAVLTADGYSFLHLEYGADENTDYFISDKAQPKQLDIALEADTTTPTFLSNAKNAPSSVWDVLDSWLVANGPFGTAVIE